MEVHIYSVKVKRVKQHMIQRYNDNTKRPKPKDNQLWILKTYPVSCKIQRRALGLRETAVGLRFYENTPEKLLHLPPKSCHNFT